MLLPCTRLQANFADQGIRLELGTPASMVWDEHGGTFVLRVGALEVTEPTGAASASGCQLEIPVTPGATVINALEEFAAQHQLPLGRPSAPDLGEIAVLAACHLPEKNLFIFAEEPALTVSRRGDAVDLSVSGVFKVRRVPCRETDLVIHLTKAAMTRLVAFVLHLARAGQQ